MLKCKICGARIEDDVAVCPSCGAKVAGEVASPSTTARDPTATTGTSAPTRPSSPVIKTICAHCGAEVIGEHRFCPQCGVNLKEAAEEKKSAPATKEPRCPSCGSVIEPNASFCPDCGVTLEKDIAKTPPPSESVLKSSDFVLIEGNANIGSFYMCTHEVTQEEYQAITGKNPSRFNGNKLPVEQVSWYEAVEYCNMRSRAEGLTPCYSGSEVSDYDCNFTANGYRLPTEAEWEYAATEGKYHSPHKYSGSDEIDCVAWYSGNSDNKTQNVMTKTPNKLGLHDMTGNVWEWCWDKDKSPSSYRIHRGGSWNDFADSCVVSTRNSGSPVYRDYSLGLRLVRSVQ